VSPLTTKETISTLLLLIDGPPRKRLLRSLTACFIWLAVASVAIALSPLALREIVNELTSKSFDAAILFTALYVALVWLNRAATAAQVLNFGRLWRTCIRRAAHFVYERMLGFPQRFYTERPTGSITQSVGDGLSGLRSILSAFSFGIIPTLIQGVAIAAVFAYIGRPDLLLVLVVLSLVYAFIFLRGINKRFDIQRKALVSDGRAAGLATESLLGQEAAKILGVNRNVSDRLDAAFEESNIHWIEFLKSQHVNQQILGVVFAGGMCTLLFVTAYQVADGSLSPGDFVLANSYLFQIVGPIERLSFASRDLVQGIGNLARLSEVYQEKTEWELSKGHQVLSGEGPLNVDIENLSFAYIANAPVLRNVTFQVPPGRSIAVVGATGSGKSSLWRLICLLYRPNSGRIAINGIDIDEIELASLRKSIAVVPQDIFLYNASIFENILIAQRQATEEEVKEAGHLAILTSLVDSLPDGWDTIVGERGVRLSGGEKQRVAIARAILRRPRLLILDEATSALDSVTEKSIALNLSGALGQTTALLVAHRLSTIQHADEIIVLNEGQIIERGSHEALLAKKGQYAAMWIVQSQKNLLPIE
jgi:ABC-type multidrug transport system fused ATPase/permease subunit